ncbi:hypothetical protein I4F81_007514 [Pyropia yezoensis]|uniref:Uncharacterized protein n=1 Tax=Pyropia yezoensis TaxID=2788 RepID=A0ACC3C5B5_PYRYE|nr:hypothetical protein I4F81_007514 [Neopyropia yezoensis]
MTLTAFHFRYPQSLMLLQSVFATTCLFVLSRVRGSGVVVPSLRRRELAKILPSSLLFVANVSVGLAALSLVNIPMFSALRRLTVLFVLGSERLLLRKRHPRRLVVAVLFLTAGAVVSAASDVTFSALGYVLVMLNNALTACYLASIKRAMRDVPGLNPLGLLYYSALLGMPLVLALSVGSGEAAAAVAAMQGREELRTGAFGWALAATAASAFFVNYSTALCTHVTSPLTTSVAAQLKNVLQTLLGFWSWGKAAMLARSGGGATSGPVGSVVLAMGPGGAGGRPHA